MVTVEQRTAAVKSLLIRLAGGFQIETDDGRPVKIANRKARGILAYLALSRNVSESRERIAGLLWSDSPEDQARASLRQCLKQLRTIFDTLGYDGFKTDRESVSLEASQASVDLHVMTRDLSAGTVSLELTDGTAVPARILYGYETLDRSFGSWLHVIRQNWHDRLDDKLQKFIRSAGVHRDVARNAAEALVKVDPTNEEAHRHLISRYADEGNIPAALKQYKTLWDHLEDEFDIEPDEETQRLIVEIKSGDYQAPAPGCDQAATATGIVARTNSISERPQELPIIGVWNFVEGGSSEHKGYLIEGFRRELIACLVRFREWMVVDGNLYVNVPYADRPVHAEHETRLCDYSLEGVYLEENNKIIVTTTLKDNGSRQYIWSEQFELSLETWAEVQNFIVRRIAIAFDIHISAERMTKIANVDDIALKTYDKWLRGQSLFLGYRAKNWKRAASIFRSFLEVSQMKGRAHSSLVQLQNSVHLVNPGMLRSEDIHRESLQLAKQSVQLDPLDSRAHLCLGWSLALNSRFDQAEISFDLANELNPNDSWTLVSSALGWSFCDQTELAIMHADQALTLGFSPSKTHWGYQATIRFMCGDYEQCISAAERAEDAIYNIPAWKAAAHFHLGQFAEAGAAMRHFLRLTRENWAAPEAPDDERIMQWFLQCFPIRNKKSWQKLHDGVKGASVRAFRQERERTSRPLIGVHASN